MRLAEPVDTLIPRQFFGLESLDLPVNRPQSSNVRLLLSVPAIRHHDALPGPVESFGSGAGLVQHGP